MALAVDVVDCLSHIHLRLLTESQFIQTPSSPPPPGISGEIDPPLAVGLDLTGLRALVLVYCQLRNVHGTPNSPAERALLGASEKSSLHLKKNNREARRSLCLWTLSFVAVWIRAAGAPTSHRSRKPGKRLWRPLLRSNKCTYCVSQFQVSVWVFAAKGILNDTELS